MGTISVLAKREFTGFFYSPIGYIVAAIFLLFLGFFFSMFVFIPGQLSELRLMFNLAQVALIFVIPAMTMGLLSDEYKSGRIEMLRTSPISELELILGKYFGALSFYLILLFNTLIFLLLLAIFGRPDYGAVAASYLGLLLVGMMFISIGLFWSSCTNSQVVALLAGILTTAVFAILLQFVTQVPHFPASLRPVITYLGVSNHMADFAAGKVGLSHCVYFLSFTLLFLFFTYLVIESKKWRS